MRKLSFVPAAFVALFVVISVGIMSATEGSWKAISVAGAIATVFLVAVYLYPTREPRVLLVGEASGAPAERLREALATAGFELQTCAGPGERQCPVTLGEPCPIREHQLAAVILREPGQTMPVPPCGKALGIPWVTVEVGSSAAPELMGPAARVGLDRGPDEVIHTLADLLVAA